MKYIVLEVTDNDLSDNDPFIREVPFIFPNSCVHVVVAESMTQMLLSERPEKVQRVIRTVSAGFLNSPDIGDGPNSCYGDSDSLKLKSRGREDSALIACYDYLHGLK